MTTSLFQMVDLQPTRLINVVGYGDEMPSSFGDPEEEYTRVKSGKAWFDESSRGRIRARGKHALDLLNRLSTNDLRGIKPGQHIKTVLTNEKGRIIDVITVIHRPDDLYLICSAGHTASVMQWIERFIIMEDVVLEDVTSSTFQLSLYGMTRTTQTIEFIASSHPEVTFCWATSSNHVTVIAPVIQALPVLETLQSAGVKPVGVTCIESLRIESTQPIFGREISDRYNPIEVGLAALISFTKGCYVGQEVIARLESYNKVQRSLILLRLDSPVDDENLSFVDHRVGLVTSVAYCYGMRATGALAIVKNEFMSNSCFDLVTATHQKTTAIRT